MVHNVFISKSIDEKLYSFFNNNDTLKKFLLFSCNQQSESLISFSMVLIKQSSSGAYIEETNIVIKGWLTLTYFFFLS